MKKLLKIAAATALLIYIISIQAINSFADYTRVTESVNLREKPSTESKVLKLVPMGYEISVLDRGGEWSEVKFEGTGGYVKSEYIEIIDGQPPSGQNAQKQQTNDVIQTANVSKKTEAPAQAPASVPKAVSADAGGGQGSDGAALRYGSEGENVRELQKLLTDKGVYAGPINGKYGPLTEEAVIRYQEEKGLEPDGVVGSETLAKLKEKPRPPGTFRNGDEGDGVRELQKLMKEKDYYRGPVNGKFGPLTEESVTNFQKLNGIEADGIAGRETLDLLKTTPKKGAAKAVSASGSGGSSSFPVAPNGVELIEWEAARKIFLTSIPARVYDVRTGVTYNVKSFSNGRHADVEPVTTEDTELLRRTFGGSWSWTPRPVWVTVNGRTMAGSINGMPHGGGVNSTNGMNGQVCLHFKGSSTHNNNKAFAQLHQDAIVEAWNAAKK